MTFTQTEIQLLLAQLKILTEETDACGIPADGTCDEAAISKRFYSDDYLLAHLEIAGYDARRAAYNVLLRKAEAGGISLASGITLPDNSAYWLRLAATLRPNSTGILLRADETLEEE